MLALILPAAGCVSAVAPIPEVQPDMQAIVAVSERAYDQLERPASVFLGADVLEDTTMSRVRTSLGSSLGAEFHAPSERASGEPGASIALGRFYLGDDGRLGVEVSFVQEDGSGRGCTEYTLEREADVWVIVGEADAWPDCPIGIQGEDTYHAALERARTNECLALGTGIGTCGPWLYVVESSGYHGTRSYFDPQTGLLVARESFTDSDEVPDLFGFGHVDCEPVVANTIPCYRTDEEAGCEAASGVWRVWGLWPEPSCNLR